MAAKPIFNAAQIEILHATARRVFKEKFSWMKKRTKDHPPGQEAMALALGISQQSVSSLLKGKYKPGLKVARNIANLDGQTLEMLVGDFEDEDAPKSSAPALNGLAMHTFKNLDVCIQFYASTKHWSPWTIAAARSGFFGTADFAAPEWSTKLDALERALEKARKAP